MQPRDTGLVVFPDHTHLLFMRSTGHQIFFLIFVYDVS